jgi:hypothetical protein
MDDFIKIFNDIQAYPTYAHLCRKLKMTHAAIDSRAKRLRSKGEPIINRHNTKYEIPAPESSLVVSKKIFVVTSVQNNSLVNWPFYKSIMQYCKHNNAQLLVGTVRYRNPTTPEEAKKLRPVWPHELKKHFVKTQINLNRNIKLMGDVFIQPTAEDPVSGLENLSGDCSAVYFHTSLRMKVVATHIKNYPKIVHTTGSLSRPNYSDSKAGAKGKFHHVQGALIVEIADDKIFHIRQINADSDGRFYDLNKFYTPDGVEKIESVPAIVYGDIHAEYIDPLTLEAVWANPNSLTRILNPKAQIWHDLIDFNVAKSHHNDKDFVLKYCLEKAGKDTVTSSIQAVANLVNFYLSYPNTTHYIVASNHNEHIERWIKECNFKDMRPQDMVLYLELVVKILKKAVLSEGGGISKAAILETALRPLLLDKFKYVFLSRNEKLSIAGIDCSNHGDKGINGGHGLNLKELSKAGVKTISGHSHVPEIYHGAYRVGTSSLKERGYNAGLSGWISTECIIYPNGKRALINIIDGQYSTLYEVKKDARRTVNK